MLPTSEDGVTSDAGLPTKQGRYQIVVQGEFGALLSTAFRDALIHVGSGTTALVIQVTDDQELFGVVDRLRDHAVKIISINREGE